jgi:hypothetical protein
MPPRISIAARKHGGIKMIKETRTGMQRMLSRINIEVGSALGALGVNPFTGSEVR